jgi:putative holliday junction resolvase
MKLVQRDEQAGRSSTVVESAGRILAIDYGRKRMGLALSDELRLTAYPLTILSRSNRQNDLRRLRELCRKHEVRQILVGHPLLLTGAPSEMAEEAARFAGRLKKNLGIPVELVDERLTSWDASQMNSAAESFARRRDHQLDDVAAALILRDYLQSVRLAAAAPSLPSEAR